MYQGVQTCKQCGANLTLDDLRKTGCPYCGTVYPHQAMAVEHAAMVNQVLRQQGVPQVQLPYQYGAPVQIGGQSYGEFVQGHVDRASRLVKVSLIVALVITLLVVAGVFAVLFAFR